MEDKKKMVNFVIDGGVWEEFKKIAYKKGTSASALLRGYILQKVKNEKKQNKS